MDGYADGWYMHDYGDICPLHHVVCDEDVTQTEDVMGTPTAVLVGYACPICRANAEREYVPLANDDECPF